MALVSSDEEKKPGSFFLQDLMVWNLGGPKSLGGGV